MTVNAYFDTSDLFVAKACRHYRIPSIALSDGKVILSLANRRMDTVADSAEEVHVVLRRSLDGGHSWEPIIDLFAEGSCHAAIGTVIADSNNGTVYLPYHRGRRNTSDKPFKQKETLEWGDFLAASKDNGRTWFHHRMRILPNGVGRCGSTHGASPGITLQHGKKKGRIIAPARFSIQPGEELETLQKHHYNCTIYSEDNGQTWQTGGPVQAGTGEGCLAELSDGTIYYNSRAYFMDGKRRVAWSYDGGETFEHFAVDDTLVEPKGGCNAGMASFPRDLSRDKDIIIFSNPVSPERETLTVHLSYDGGKTWPVSKIIHAGPAGYSSVAVSPDGIIFVLYENGVDHPYEKISVARFNLDWITS